MRKLIAFFAFLLVAIPANAANWYVNKAASGSNNGTSWTNAWTDFGSINFATVACGDTIWVAAGSYTGSMTLSKVCTSGNLLTISSVLSTDTVPTSAPGYSSSYAYPNQVINTGGGVTAGSGSAYVRIDGRMGDAATSVPYGMWWTYPGGIGGVTAFSNTGSLSTGIQFSHLEIKGPPCVSTYDGVVSGNRSGTCTGSTWGINLNQGSGTTGWLVDHCWVHQFAEVIRPYQTTNLTIQYSYIGEDTYEQAINNADHEDWMYGSNPITGLTLIGNRWYSSGNDGIFFDNAGSTNTVMINNIFFRWGFWSSSFGKTGTCGPYIVLNNTFFNDGLGSDVNGNEYSYGVLGSGGCTPSASSQVTNNIFYNVSSISLANSYTTYNAGTTSNGNAWSCGTGCFSYSNASPLQNFTGFVNPEPSGSTTVCSVTVGVYCASAGNVVVADFHLSTAGKTLFQGKGTNLTSQCGTYPSLCTDLDGNARPSSGAWDLGAYVATASGGSVTLAPTSQAFGSVNVGSSSSPVTFTLTNSSSTTATSISPMTTGGNASDFTITNSGAGSCNAAGNSIAASASCTFTITFSPSSSGSRSTTLSVAYSGGDSASPQTSALSGTGVATVTGVPVFSPCAGPVCNFTGSQVVTLTSSTGAAVICVRADGTAPTTLAAGTCGTGSTTVTNGGTITVTSSETIQALATAVGFTNSAVVTVTFNIGTAAAVSMFGD